jgi:hypothetical protein
MKNTRCRPCWKATLDRKKVLSILLPMKKLLKMAPMSILMLCVFCSEAPLVDFPEPTNRVVLAEFFTKDT